MIDSGYNMPLDLLNLSTALGPKNVEGLFVLELQPTHLEEMYGRLPDIYSL